MPVVELFRSSLLLMSRGVPNAIWRVPNSPHGGPLDFDEDLSSLGLGTFDYVRMAHLNGSITDEGALLRKAFQSVFRSLESDLWRATDGIQISSTGHRAHRDDVHRLEILYSELASHTRLKSTLSATRHADSRVQKTRYKPPTGSIHNGRLARERRIRGQDSQSAHVASFELVA